MTPAKRALRSPKAEAADLVIASYLIGELGEAERKSLAEAMWAKTRDTLLIVEPGTPAGYARILNARAQLIAAGAHVLAPCPHDNACPLRAPDWCHFSQRLARSRAHKQVKGADVPFEDERFSYVVLTRAPATARASRVLAQPASARPKFQPSSARPMASPSPRCRAATRRPMRRARHWRWGDAIDGKKLRLSTTCH